MRRTRLGTGPEKHARHGTTTRNRQQHRRQRRMKPTGTLDVPERALRDPRYLETRGRATERFGRHLSLAVGKERPQQKRRTAAEKTVGNRRHDLTPRKQPRHPLPARSSPERGGSWSENRRGTRCKRPEPLERNRVVRQLRKGSNGGRTHTGQGAGRKKQRTDRRGVLPSRHAEKRKDYRLQGRTLPIGHCGGNRSGPPQTRPIDLNRLAHTQLRHGVELGTHQKPTPNNHQTRGRGTIFPPRADKPHTYADPPHNPIDASPLHPANT